MKQAPKLMKKDRRQVTLALSTQMMGCAKGMADDCELNFDRWVSQTIECAIAERNKNVRLELQQGETE